ncbi:MAG: hypothetical protein IPK59_22300 [Rhodospirillaceae bacterium]|nr:hypothetical protein [Rhodospirillaceae bacterium]
MTKSMCGLVVLGILLAASQGANAAGNKQSFCASNAGKLDIKIRSCGVDADVQSNGGGGVNNADGTPAGGNPAGGNPNNNGGGGGFNNNGPKDKKGPNQG